MSKFSFLSKDPSNSSNSSSNHTSTSINSTKLVRKEPTLKMTSLSRFVRLLGKEKILSIYI
jgi:hypothetical protein